MKLNLNFFGDLWGNAFEAMGLGSPSKSGLRTRR